MATVTKVHAEPVEPPVLKVVLEMEPSEAQGLFNTLHFAQLTVGGRDVYRALRGAGYEVTVDAAPPVTRQLT